MSTTRSLLSRLGVTCASSLLALARPGEAAPCDEDCKTPEVSAEAFGFSIAVSGDDVFVGAPHADTSTNPNRPLPGAGKVYIYRTNSGPGCNLTLLQELVVTEGNPAGDHFGWSVAVSGNIAVIGAPGDDLGNISDDEWDGSAYVFEKDLAGMWSLSAKLSESGEDDGCNRDRFGESVATDGTKIVVGAPDFGHAEVCDKGGSNCVIVCSEPFLHTYGAAFVYELGSSTPIMLEASVKETDDAFGTSVAVSGDLILVGAPYYEPEPQPMGRRCDLKHPCPPGQICTEEEVCIADTSANYGAVYVFRNLVVPEEAVLTASSPSPNLNLGAYLSVDAFAAPGSVALVGAHGPFDALCPISEGGTGSYMFRHSGGTTWNQEFSFTTDAVGGRSGVVRGDVALVSGAEELSRRVFTYQYEGGEWCQQAVMLPSNTSPLDYFGRAIAMDGAYRAVVSNASCPTDDIGEGYVFDGLSDARPDSCCIWDLTNDGLVATADFQLLLQLWTPPAQDPCGLPDPDFDDDGNVGTTDFLALLQHWGVCP